MDILEAVSLHLNCPARPVFVAYSGGVDSHVLLHCISQLMDKYPQHQYAAIHINHGLSPNARHWQQHCQQVCQSLAIDLISQSLSIDASPRTSLEAQAREERYHAIIGATPDNAMIMLGQHLDDQLETFLLQLKRGAGPKGLSCMAAVQSAADQRQYIRPLLSVNRESILHYAHQQGLAWQEDESNQDSRFDRNFLRHQIVPLLAQRWPAMAKSVARSAALCAEQQSLLDDMSRQYVEEMQSTDNSLQINVLLTLSSNWQKQIIRQWLSQQNIPLPNAKIMGVIEAELLRAPDDSEACIRWQHWQLRKFNQCLYVLTEQVPPSEEIKIWRGEQSLLLANDHIRVEFSYQDNQGLRLAFNDRKAIIKVGFGAFSESFKPAGERFSKPLKKWLQHWKIPPWQRRAIPLVYVNGQLAMVVGLANAAGYCDGEHKVWIKSARV